MKKILFSIILLSSIQVFSQNQKMEINLTELIYEDKITEKACICLSEMDSITDAQQAVIKCIIKAKNKVHEEDVENKHKRDFTVEGIRKLNKQVTELLIENCEIVSKNY